MYKFKYKEKDHAEELLKNSFSSKHVSSELKILAKYYRQEGKTDEEIKQLLCDFCKKHLKGYNLAIHFKMINSTVKFVAEGKNKLVQIDSVNVSKSELEYIDKMDLTHEYKKVVFTLLVLTKLNKLYVKIKDGELKSNEYYFGGDKKYKELVGSSKITFDKTKKSKVKNIHDLIHILNEKGIVEIAGNGNVKLNFMYEIETSEDVEIIVDNYNVIGLHYDFYYGDIKVKKCECCDMLIKIKGKNQKFCDECWSIIRSVQNKEKALRYYHKNK